MARFVSSQLLIFDAGSNSQIVLGYKKFRLSVSVALKIFNANCR